ncbi:MAG: hypothetical protein AAB439_00945 [Patescibacteria group bacterium]
MIEVVLGYALMFMSLLVVFFAFPSQVWKNHKDKKFGISLILVLFGIGIYSLRIPYTFIREDYFILIPDIFGLLVHLILIYQFFLYRRSK